MLVAGLTGGIGTGKSSVGEMLAARGAGIIDADIAARAVVRPGRPAYEEIVQTFGKEVLNEQLQLDRQKLADVVFADREARAKLEAITHPRIGEWIAARLTEYHDSGTDVVVVEVPLLFESGWEKMYPIIIVVWADEPTAIKRLIDKGFKEEDARARLAAQMPINEKAEKADYIVKNTGTLSDLLIEVDKLWSDLKSRVEQ
jgi:dephospho-CoA kinase